MYSHYKCILRLFVAPVPPHIQQDSVQPSPEVTEQKQQAEQVTVLSESIHTSLKVCVHVHFHYMLVVFTYSVQLYRLVYLNADDISEPSIYCCKFTTVL